MYKIEAKHYGIHLTFADVVGKPELEKWLAESQQKLKSVPKSFGVLIDMRRLKPLDPDAKQLMEKGQALYKSSGMQRSCVIVESAMLAVQFEQIAKQSGIYAFERYLASANHPDWEQRAVNWIKNGVDPGATN